MKKNQLRIYQNLADIASFKQCNQLQEYSDSVLVYLDGKMKIMEELEMIRLLQESVILNLISWASANKKPLLLFKS